MSTHTTETRLNRQDTLELGDNTVQQLEQKYDKYHVPLAGCTCCLLQGQKVNFRGICCKLAPDPRDLAL